MSLTTKDHLSLTLQSIKKLLSFKADKSEVVFRSEIDEISAVEIVAEMGIVEPLRASDGTIYTSPEGEVYTLK